ncbi:nucleolar protein 58 [Eurytemora carolleeae]|uniref:nucleolar protein 58 n=1 Tax=Eurytemora carolleeae TaxID=1294199 RepID=UPI000C781ED1|nr:nucleolar protein 58 [Eurytemora carolleeae]|eukprot:XP_023344986.1 nucleolar protein 58-like [Eurytemora affinis]
MMVGKHGGIFLLGILAILCNIQSIDGSALKTPGGEDTDISNNIDTGVSPYSSIKTEQSQLLKKKKKYNVWSGKMKNTEFQTAKPKKGPRTTTTKHKDLKLQHLDFVETDLQGRDLQTKYKNKKHVIKAKKGDMKDKKEKMKEKLERKEKKEKKEKKKMLKKIAKQNKIKKNLSVKP